MIKFNWGTGIVLFLIMFLLLGFYFIYFSFQHHNDLVEDDYYEQGANYNEQMAIDKRSSIYQDSVWVENTGKFVSVTLAPSIAAMTDSVQAFFYFPSDKRKDFLVNITDPTQSTLVDKNDLAKGRYTLKLAWYEDSEKFMINQDIFVSQ